jgi:peptidoglycan/xylan/chitin deacetylase (PgdA/CDA1 family)
MLVGAGIRHTPQPGTIALTFDDGPSPATTPRLLDLLDRHGARATFFVLGVRARAYPDLVREIAARGHALGNHTDTHLRLTWRSQRTVERELRGCQMAILDAAGSAPAIHRPPFGYPRPGLAAIAARLGMPHVVMWSVMTRDWTGAPATIDRRLAHVGDRDIVVMHDGDHRDPAANREALLHALAEWLPRWQDAGRRTVTLAGDPPGQSW